MRHAIRLAALAALLFTPPIARAQQPLGGWRGLETRSLGGSCSGRQAATFGALGIYTAVGTAVDAMIVGRTRVFEAGRESIAALITPSDPQLALRVT